MPQNYKNQITITHTTYEKRIAFSMHPAPLRSATGNRLSIPDRNWCAIAKNDPTMTWVNGRIAASVGTADSYVSFPILYLFIFRKTLVAKIRIIFSDQAHSSLKKRGFAKIQNNDEPSTPTGVELQVTAHDTMCGSKCLPNPRPQRRSNLSTDYMVRPRWGRMYRSHLAIRKSLTLRLTGVRPFSGSVCLHTFILHKRLNSNIKSVYILQRIYLLCSY